MTTATARRWSDRIPVFWIVAFLIPAVLTVLIYDANRMRHSLIRDADGALAVAERTSDAYLSGLKPVLAVIDGAYGMEMRAPLAAEIDTSIDAAFAPVYARIDDYLDFHYSLKGEYSEIAATLAGDFGDSMKERLFDVRTLETALAHADRSIADTFDGALTGSVAAVRDAARQHLPLTDADMTLLRDEGLISVVQADTLDRFSPDLVAARTAGAVAGTAAVLRGSRMLATRMARRVAAKLGTKAAGRLASGSGGMAAGAGVGSALGPVGTVIGGAAGALAGWIATDAAIVELDEVLNRDEFRRDLVTMIDGQRDRAKVAALTRYETLLDSIAADQKAVFRTPAERFL